MVCFFLTRSKLLKLFVSTICSGLHFKTQMVSLPPEVSIYPLTWFNLPLTWGKLSHRSHYFGQLCQRCLLIISFDRRHPEIKVFSFNICVIFPYLQDNISKKWFILPHSPLQPNWMWFHIPRSLFKKVGGLDFLLQCDFEISKSLVKLSNFYRQQ